MKPATPLHTPSNPTVAAIVARLPKTPLVSPDDISAALGLKSTRTVLDAIAARKIAAVKVGTQYRIACAEARRWIATLEAAQ